jgi:long-subunit fatty acid transport protein
LKLASVPDSTCYFFSRSRGEGAQLRGRSKLALCLAKTAEQEFELTALNYRGESAGRRVDQTHSFREVWSSWSLGPTFAIHVTEELTLGASLHLTRTRHETTTSVATVVEELDTSLSVASAYQSADSGSSWDALAQVGASYQLSRTVTLGASLQAPSIHFTGSYEAVEDARFTSDAGSISHFSGEGSFKVRTPLRLNLGVGAEYERLRLEANAFLYAPVEEFAHAEFERNSLTAVDQSVTGRSERQVTRNESVRGIVNVGIGAEYFVSKDLSVLFGLASDVSALPPRAGSQDERLFHSRFNAWHAGVGLSTYTDYGDLVVGLRGDYLTGTVSSVNAFSQPIERENIDAREWAAMLVLAGRVSLSTVAEAAEAVGEAVTGEAKKPAATPQKPLQPPKLD